MSEVDTSQHDVEGLSTLLDVGDVGRHQWKPKELAEMASHQWAAPLYLSLGTFSGQAIHLLAKTSPQLPTRLTLGQLLGQPHPPTSLLRLVKQFAKQCRGDANHPLPQELVMLLYYASVVAAERAGEPISQLPPASLRRGLRWLCEQTWVEGEIRTLLEAGRDRLGEQG